MSLILDALNRARDDVNPVPGLATHHRVELVAANRRQYLLWVALSVAVVVIAWLIVERYSAPRPAENAVDVVARVAQPPREPAPDAWRRATLHPWMAAGGRGPPTPPSGCRP